jgi:predicted O-methyltransferase YrrM
VSDQTRPAVSVVERIARDLPAMHKDGQARWDVSPATLAFLAATVREADRTLEVGCGVSTVVFAATGARHLAISPAPDEMSRIREYCARIGVDSRCVDYREGLSHEVLPTLTGEYDVVLVDGAHAFPFPVVDFHYVSRLLRPGGVLVLDDVPIPSVATVYRFLMSEPAWVRLAVLDDRAAAFRLVRPVDAGDPWGSQAMNAGYPDFSFLPPARRTLVSVVERGARSRAARRVRGRFPALDRVAPRLRRWLG